MINPQSQTQLDQPRFRGPAASLRAQHWAGAVTVAAIAITAAAAVAGQWWAVAFFAVGAGAGYSLSGSV